MGSEGFLVWGGKPGFSETDVSEVSPCGQYVRYKKILGRGAFKDVYKGFDQVNNIDIAWNQICIDDFNVTTSNALEICSEAILLKSLSHTNIMKCHSFWIDHNSRTVNMITELFSGSLRQYVKKLGGVDDVQTIKNWGRQILQGLHYLHTRNPTIIHRDLKCDNIFFDAKNGEIKIGDFGLAAVVDQRPLRVLVGTPEFMAAEYYDEEYDELVDIYAFGMCLMELVTCDYPYSECTNPAQIFKKVSSGIKPAALGKVKSGEVKEIIEKCLLPASLRPSAEELLKDPFFSSMGTEDNGLVMSYSSSSEVVLGGGDSSMEQQAWGKDQYLGMKSCCSMGESVISGISALYNSSMSLSEAPAYHGELPSSCYHYSVGDVSMNSRIISGISALYNNSVSLSEAGAFNGEPRSSCCYQSSVGDVTMNSRITFASSSCAVSKDLGFSVSRVSLSGKSYATKSSLQ